MEAASSHDGVVTDRHVLQVISMVAILLVASLAIYDFFFDRNVTRNPAQITVSNVTMMHSPGGGSSLSVSVRNIGTETVFLKGHISSAYPSPLVFAPTSVHPGETAVGVADTSWYAAKFDGLSGYVKVPDSPVLNPSTLTLETSFKYDGYFPDQQMIFGKGAAGGDSFYFYTFRSHNNINEFVLFNNGIRYDQPLGSVLTPRTWYTLDFTMDGRSVAAYLNGDLSVSWANAIQFKGNSNDLLVGECSCGGYYFNGSMAYFRIYNRALSASEVQSNYLAMTPTKDGLVLWLSFNQTSGSTIADLSGYGGSGTLGGGVSFAPAVEPCRSYSVLVTASASDGTQYSLSQNGLSC